MTFFSTLERKILQSTFSFTRERDRDESCYCCLCGTRGLLCQKLLEGINTLLRRKRGRHFWAFLEKGAKGKEALSSIRALETQLSSSYLLKKLGKNVDKISSFRCFFSLFFSLATFFWVWNENHYSNALPKNLKSLDSQ